MHTVGASTQKTSLFWVQLIEYLASKKKKNSEYLGPHVTSPDSCVVLSRYMHMLQVKRY
jgi:hypothetical protein